MGRLSAEVTIDVPTAMRILAAVTAALTLSTALMRTITRAVEVPRSGHWLPEENPEFVTAELLRFFV